MTDPLGIEVRGFAQRKIARRFQPSYCLKTSCLACYEFDILPYCPVLRPMLARILTSIATLVILGHSFVTGSNFLSNPFCDLHYGRPSYNDCLDLSYALYDTWPGLIADDLDHFFSLRYRRTPAWIPRIAEQHRVYVPKTVQHGLASTMFETLTY